MSEARQRADLESVARGDVAALQRLLVTYHESMRRVVTKAADPALRALIDPDDVLQNTYVAAFRGFARVQFDGPAHFYGWLKQVALNQLRDGQRMLRRQKRDVARVRPQPAGPATTYAHRLCTLAGHTQTPSRIARRGEMVAALLTCMAQLDDDQRDVIRLRFLESLPVGEIAQRLGRSEGAVYGLCARGLRKLRDLMGPVTDFLSAI
ncbi:MAG: sigma-70 family RNA polymerase sigma factor [Phycisphaerae bacterium]|nr:sigma-70 family RNA polymerase sigma factor [Phycisphaerae bacterium]